MRAFLRDILITLIIAAAISFGLRAVISQPIVISSSMEPTLEVGQRLIVIKITYKFHEPERGDVITFYPPDNGKEEYIKRIIGLPGESVEVKEGVVYIHNEHGTVLPLDEPYVAKPDKRPFEGDIIPENEYFVMGDNRINSGDSRTGWTVPRQNIIGKAWLSIWPPDKWGLVVNYLSHQ